MKIIPAFIEKNLKSYIYWIIKISWSFTFFFIKLQLQDEDEGGEEKLGGDEDLYQKARDEFFDIINKEKKNMEKKKDAEMDKADPGKV